MVRLATRDGLSDESKARVRGMIEAAVGFRPAMEFVRVAAIPRTSRGKHRLVISRVPVSFLDLTAR